MVDAADKPLGRLASEIAAVLRGKHKPTFTPHVDTGDFVVVVNCAKVKLTGQKLDQKHYYHHSGSPGGIRTESYRHLLAAQARVRHREGRQGHAPARTSSAAQMLTKLKVYDDPRSPPRGPEAEAARHQDLDAENQR